MASIERKPLDQPDETRPGTFRIEDAVAYYQGEWPPEVRGS
jgi:hypothetical protein